MEQVHPAKFKFQVVVDSVVIGVVAGLGAVMYRYFLVWAAGLSSWIFGNDSISWIIFVFLMLTVMGLVTAKLLRWAPLSGGSGIPQVSGEFHGTMDMNSERTIISKYIGGILSITAGMSLGREGPSIQIGAAAGKWMSRLMKRDLTKERVLITAGASAGLAAAFNAPLAAAFNAPLAATLFVLEEIHKSFGTIILMPSLIAALIADVLSKYVFGLRPSFYIPLDRVIDPSQYIYLIGLGVVTAFVGLAFTKTLLSIQTLSKRLFPRIEVRVVVGFLISGVVGFTFFSITGSGHTLVENLLVNPATLSALSILLVTKLLFTSISYNSGVPGGIFLPNLVIGALTGMVYYQLLNLMGAPVEGLMSHFVVLAMAGLLTAVIRSPITSIVLVSEMTGSLTHILTIAIVATVAYLVMEWLGIEPIYETLYDRMAPEEKPVELNHEKVILQYSVPALSDVVNLSIKEMNLPQNALIISLMRNETSIIPQGDTILKSFDQLRIVVNHDSVGEVQDYFKDLAG